MIFISAPCSGLVFRSFACKRRHLNQFRCPEKGGSTLLWNVEILNHYMVQDHHPEEGGRTFLRKVETFNQYMVKKSIRKTSLHQQLFKPLKNYKCTFCYESRFCPERSNMCESTKDLFFLQTQIILHSEHFIWSWFFNREKRVPVTTAWLVLRLRMEERPRIWRVAANILNKQSRTADKGWPSSLGVGRGVDKSSL